MRREEYFLGDFDKESFLNESVYRRGLETIVEGFLPEAQQYDALQAFVHWGIAGQRPDLALEAYNQYVTHGWSWKTNTLRERELELGRKMDEYDQAKLDVEMETGQTGDGMKFFTVFDVEYLGPIQQQVRDGEEEGKSFRNSVLPQIIEGLVADGQVQEAHDFLVERRAIHKFRGYPREVEPSQVVDMHIATAEALVEQLGNFKGDPEAAFVDLVTFALEYAQFPQFGVFENMHRFGRIQQDMVSRGFRDPWQIFIDRLDVAVRDFEGVNNATPEFVFNGIRHYLEAEGAGMVPELRTLRDWPESALQAFDIVEQNPSIPSGLAWLIPMVRNGDLSVSASDAFQSDPVFGKNILLAAFGDEAAQAAVREQAATEPQAAVGEVSLESVLKKVTGGF